jgi:type IV secretory pathway ATPase VirB11/archaellum biosynthesis ATPase
MAAGGQLDPWRPVPFEYSGNEYSRSRGYPAAGLSDARRIDWISWPAYCLLLGACGRSIPRRALEIAVAGGHNIMLIGSPGSGKTLLAERMTTILPPMTREGSLETTLIFSAAGKIPAGCGLLASRPYRAWSSSGRPN